MANNPPKRLAPQPNRSLIGWLLDSDSSIYWKEKEWQAHPNRIPR
jgi:hypothetical protein